MNILLADEEECEKRLNIDDLYEKNFRRDMKQISVFNKIMNRIHKRILTTSKVKRDEKAIWFVVPEFLFGEATYDMGECIAYVVKKLTDNGFSVRYMHPNTLFISWENWVPSYVRNKIKKSTGVTVNEKGEVVKRAGDGDGVDNETEGGGTNHAQETDPTMALLNMAGGGGSGGAGANNGQNQGKNYTPIGQYKPTGALLYNDSLFRRIDERRGKS